MGPWCYASESHSCLRIRMLTGGRLGIKGGLKVRHHPFNVCKTDSQADLAENQHGHSRVNFRVMLVTFVVGIGLMALKFLGYWVTGSSAILSDALESIINVVASGFGLGSIIFSAKPADESHPLWPWEN